jgi:hypothetical protein
MNIGFFVRHFSERGTEVAIFDYAKYNEVILHNNSYIICFSHTTKSISYNKFKNRFPIIEIDNIEHDIQRVIKEKKLDFFYTLTYGGGNDFYHFENKNIWNNCKTIKHCVFETNYPESDFYISISKYLNRQFKTDIPVIPHMINLPICNENLRHQLGIPNDAIVLGRYGCNEDFNVRMAQEAVIEYINSNNNIYFLFMNTDKFYEHPQLIYLDMNIDMEYKVKFINTCDGMIHARLCGETFGLSIGEFSSKNKPIITCKSGALEHIDILGDKAIIYNSKEELLTIFKNIKNIIQSRNDWNAYDMYNPKNVMMLFNDLIFSKI